MINPDPSTDTTQRLLGLLADARTELQRVDSKASTLLAFTGAALTIVLAILGRTHLPTAAVITGWAAVAVLGYGVVLLALAIQPHLGGDRGWIRYATRTDAASVLADISDHTTSDTALAEHLAWIARTAKTKYQRIRLAVWALVTGLAAITATALLALHG